ncbi:sigma-70 family RNA polymerase sigma factor [Quadrisphaera sp. INWT6]|uniref:sigma-70 family RNA polymerase sigma factor n=1 Tax=Quadrisphaera sp. INWT6 TaxID=2596917 RepID=UPI0019D5C437|nr:sigma-70 family RNA polymerase sigma factor [Quadrisphaera sp. INWT6]
MDAADRTSAGPPGPPLALAAPARTLGAGRTRAPSGGGVLELRPDLEAVFRRDHALVVGVAARVLGTSADARGQAEDVAQEVFLSFARSRVPADQARGWLCVAATHTALNALRTRRRRTAREDAVVAGRADDEAVAGDVADDVVAAEERRGVREALARLPRKQATALVLRHSGLSYAEVASALHLSPTSVGTTVRRAESALREELRNHASPR